MNSTEVTVSVIIPVYNSEKVITNTIQSVKEQTYKNIEIIVVDDGSTDNSLEILNLEKNNDSRISVIHTSNKGVSSARNTGVELARGRWVIFVDSDDKIDSEFVERLVKLGQSYNAELVISGLVFDYVADNEQVNRSSEYTVNKSHYINGIHKNSNEFELLYSNNYLQSSCGKLYSLSFIKENNLRFRTDISSYEDLLFNLECLEIARKVYIYNMAMYHYIHRNVNSNSTCYKSDMQRQMLFVSKYLIKIYSDVLCKANSKYLTHHIIQLFINCINNASKDRRHEASTAIKNLFSEDVFLAYIDNAEIYPNFYSKIICKLGRRGKYNVILNIARIRNFIRSIHNV